MTLTAAQKVATKIMSSAPLALSSAPQSPICVLIASPAKAVQAQLTASFARVSSNRSPAVSTATCHEAAMARERGAAAPRAGARDGKSWATGSASGGGRKGCRWWSA